MDTPTDEKKNYAERSQWQKIKVLSLGGKWAYGVGIIQDNRGVKKVRIVKGKLTNPLKKNLEEWKEIDLEQDPNPISQVNKMNLKRLEEFTAMTGMITEMFETLDATTEPTPQTPSEE